MNKLYRRSSSAFNELYNLIEVKSREKKIMWKKRQNTHL